MNSGIIASVMLVFAMASILPASANGKSYECPDSDWTHDSRTNLCYNVNPSGQRENFYQAKRICETLGGSLLILKNRLADQVASEVVRPFLLTTIENPDWRERSMWIGLQCSGPYRSSYHEGPRPGKWLDGTYYDARVSYYGHMEKKGEGFTTIPPPPCYEYGEGLSGMIDIDPNRGSPDYGKIVWAKTGEPQELQVACQKEVREVSERSGGARAPA